MYFWYETWGYSWDINGINEESDQKTWDFAGILFLDKPGLVLSP